jgi:hypothetical protein
LGRRDMGLVSFRFGRHPPSAAATGSAASSAGPATGISMERQK